MTIGDSASFERTIVESDVLEFARLSGDNNPLHIDSAYAEGTPFKQRVVHGMFLGSLCSRLLGTQLPGRRCLYLSQELRFHQPVFIGDTVTVSGVVTHASTSTGVCDVSITISARGMRCASGTAKVRELA